MGDFEVQVEVQNLKKPYDVFWSMTLIGVRIARCSSRYNCYLLVCASHSN